MKGDYTCPFLHNSGNVCGKPCMRPEGCKLHYKAKQRHTCIECGKATGSISGRCRNHIRGFYVSRHYFKHYEKTERKQTECQYCKVLNVGDERFGHNQAGCVKKKEDMKKTIGQKKIDRTNLITTSAYIEKPQKI